VGVGGEGGGAVSRGRGPMDVWIRGATVVTGDGARVTDIGIRGGKIASLDSARDHGTSGAEGLDAAGLVVLPGGIDPHVHLELPTAAGVSSDSFSSGTLAAACGGVGTVFDFAFYRAGWSLGERLERRRRTADGRVSVDYGLHVELAAADLGRTDEIRRAALDGQRGFKVYMAFGDPEVEVGPGDLKTFGTALSGTGGLLVVHAEAGPEIARRQREFRSRGMLAARHHARARPPEAEAQAIDTVLEAAARADVEAYVVHVSSRQGLDRIRHWKAGGARVWAETCPQYLLLTDEVYDGDDGVQYLANPPLRQREDCEALWEGVRDGTIDTVATDHCPFPRAAKTPFAEDFIRAPKGLPGVETRLPLMYTEAVVRRGISLERLGDVLSTRAARILGLFPGKGTIAVGSDADLVVLDPRRDVPIRASSLHMNADFNPYEGRVVRGWPAHVFVRGECVFAGGEYRGGEGFGRYVGDWIPVDRN